MGSPHWTAAPHEPLASPDERPPSALDEVVFVSPSVTIGAFRCPTWHPSFEDSGAIQNDIFVFPRRCVQLCHEGARPFLADPGQVTFYNKGQRYSRHAVSPLGDECEWFAVDHALVKDAVARHEPLAGDLSARVFRFSHGPCRPKTYAIQRALFETLQAGDPLDALQVEETVLDLLSDVLSSAYERWNPVRPTPPPTLRQLEAAEDVRRLFALRLGDPLRLADVAQEVGMSAFHLCRAFRAATGSSLHRYRNQMRLHEALGRLRGDEDLTQIGLDLGYSSHSHFTSAFRTLFGLTPSHARGRFRFTASPSRRSKR